MRFLVLGNYRDRRLLVHRLTPVFPDVKWMEIRAAGELGQALVQDSFDLVVMVYALPWTQGDQALKAIQDRFPAVPVILVVTADQVEAAEAALRGGFGDWVLRRHLSYLPSLARSYLEQARLRQRCAELEQQPAWIEEHRRSPAGSVTGELGAVFGSLVDPILVYDAGGRITRANPAAQKLLGFDPLGKDVQALMERVSLRREHEGPALLPEEFPSIRALAGETVRNERVFLTCARGQEWVVLASAAPLHKDERLVGAVLALRDVTAQEETRELGDLFKRINTHLMTVARSEEALQQVLVEAAEGLHAGVASLNRHEGEDWVVRHVYGLPATMLGYHFSDPGGSLESAVIHAQGVLPIEDLGQYGSFGELVAQQYGTRSLVIVTLMLWGETMGIMVFGYPAGLHSLTAAELEFARQLSLALSLAQENVRLYEQARQDAETRAMLLREVNHRVKNNLAAIVGLVYAQMDRPEVQEQPACQVVLRNLVRGTENLSTVHGMLADSEWTPLPLDELTSRVLRTSLQAVPPEQVVLQVRPSTLCVTPGQAYTLALVVNELTLNIVKYALPGQAPLQVTAEAEQIDGEIVLTIRDNGPGYPAEVLAGTRFGAGLQLAQNLVVRNLRGQLVLRNDAGAVAEIRFPLAEEHSEE